MNKLTKKFTGGNSNTLPNMIKQMKVSLEIGEGTIIPKGA